MEAPVSRTVGMDGKRRPKTRARPKVPKQSYEHPVDAAARRNRERLALARAERGGTEPMDSEPEDKEAFLKDFFGPVSAAQELAGSQSVSATPEKDPDRTRTPRPQVAPDDGTPQSVTDRQFDDPSRVSIKSLTPAARDMLVINFASANDLEVGAFLGIGEFGAVYRVNPTGGTSWPSALKVTFDKEEANTYAKIKKQREALPKKVGDILPQIYAIDVAGSPPLMHSPAPPSRLQLAPPGEGKRLKTYFIHMELLEPLDKELKTDLFGAKGQSVDVNLDFPDQGARARFVKNYLSAKNIYSAMAEILGNRRLGEIRKALSTTPLSEGPLTSPEEARAKTAVGHAARELGIEDLKFVPVFEEINKRLEPIRERLLHLQGRDDLTQNLNKVHRDLVVLLEDVFQKYVSDTRALELVDMVTNMTALDPVTQTDKPVLMVRMGANVSVPNYDPKRIHQRPWLGRKPGAFASPDAKNAYLRLAALKKASAGDLEYADVHSKNMMQRPNGDLVVGDVGLFYFADEEGKLRQHGHLVEQQRLQALAGVILK
tara:strand:- start:791 stop:2422 length:1632 start_codon:yes stop_codon:yes gene_type:complete